MSKVGEHYRELSELGINPMDIKPRKKSVKKHLRDGRFVQKRNGINNYGKSIFITYGCIDARNAFGKI